MAYRCEYPRPQFMRENWQSLNGVWEFEFDDLRTGQKDKWFIHQKQFSRKIEVPFAYQCELSGIHTTEQHDVVWYKRQFDVTEDLSDKLVIIHFGAVDYQADIWINEKYVYSHEGGHISFCVEIQDQLKKGINTITIRVEDFSSDLTLPRGKQYWKEKPEGIWYSNTTGIWQPVWLEIVSKSHIENVRYTPLIDTYEIEIESIIKGLSKKQAANLCIRILFDNKIIVEKNYTVNDSIEKRKIKLNEFDVHSEVYLWTPEQPYLYDIELILSVENKIVDYIKSYFGMRKIETGNNKVLLNNKEYYMKLVLNQGYYPNGLLTAETDETFQKDIILIKEMGFNGVRIHQKVEDPRFLYWCDKKGLLVWSEMPNAFNFSNNYVSRFTKEFQEVLMRDYNHPCIIVWVPLNESWGVPDVKCNSMQQSHALAMYYLTKSLDSTRLVMSNDGWEHLKSDLCTIHDYESDINVLKYRYEKDKSIIESMICNREVYVGDHVYHGEPIIVSEFGGISLSTLAHEGWGYTDSDNIEDYTKMLRGIVETLKESIPVKGFCYTQLTDIMQETNGLLTFDRKPKIPLNTIKSIID